MKNNILKSIFLIIILLLGVSHAAFAYDWEEGKTLYFDNSVTQWSEVYVIIGKNNYSRAYQMDAVANTTLYKYTMSPKWEGYSKFVIASSIGGSALDGKKDTSIETAYGTCESRISSVSDNISADVLIKVTGNTSPYSRDILTSFDLNDYSTTNKLPSANGEVSNLIIFNTSTATKSAWLWNDGVGGKQFATTVVGSANNTTLSYYDNSTNNFTKAIAFKSEGSGSNWPGDEQKLSGDISSNTTYTDGNRYYTSGTNFSIFTHLSATFNVSSSSPSTNTTITLTANPNANATLYKDAGNSAKYAFYVKDAESNITCLSSFSTTNSISYTTPSTAQTITLYCYVRDLYGLETIQYSREIIVSSATTYTVTIATNNAEYGSVSKTEVADVASGTSISASANELTIGNTTVIATPTAQTDQYTYSFNEWTGIPNGNEVTENITVTANFSRANRTYTITYYLNEGAWNGNPGASSYTYGTGLNPLPTNIQRAGYTFDGWYTSDDFSGNAVTSISDTQTGDITLYAKWTENKYSVTITAGEGGTVSPSREQQVGTTPIDITATPADGYDFVNWTASTNQITIADENAAKTTVTATAAGTVTANFKKKTYTVTFNANGHGTAPVPQNNIEHGDKATEPDKPTATGYTFGGWYTDEGCTKKYDFSTDVTQDITLYAKWTKNYSKDTYYYFDERVTGWNPTQEKPKPGEVMVNTEEYAYIKRPAYNDTDNKFKIFPTNPKGEDNTKIANDENIAKGNLKGDIELGDGDKEWHNILMPSTDKDYFVILYYPYTTINPSNNFLVAASYSLPNAEPYNVTFGVVGNTGGTLTAKSGSSTIESGALVSFATFTATPAAGYSVEGWYSDAEGKTKIDAAGTNTTYSQAITTANNTVYVKFAKKYAIYFKPNAPINWGEVWVYMFTDDVWNKTGDNRGVNVSNPARSEYGKMSKLNDSVYYYNLTSSTDVTVFALNDKDQHTNGELYQCNAIYRSDFHKDMPVFIAEKGQSADTKNNTQYYSKGVWMKFNDTDPGYNLCLYTNSEWDVSTYRFTADNAGDYVSTVNVVLNAGQEYSFWVKNDKNYYFKTSKATCTAEKYRFTFYTYDMGGDSITITPDVTGTYTFQLNLANGKVEIDVLYPTTQYRLVYVEKDKDNDNIVKFHPSHIIKSHPEATAEAPMFDTVSMHVRPKVFGKTRQDTIDNPNTCKIWLQKFQTDGETMVWNTIETYIVKQHLTANGVYNFVIAQGASTTLLSERVHPYTGRYYIRTDASDGGWVNFKQFSNLCYYTDYSRVYRGFDYYYCHWAPKANIKYTIACDYSECVSDTLAREGHAPHSTYTDENGKLKYDANVRFMWNSFSNELDRAYIAGADDNLYLMSEARIYDMKGNQNTSAKLEDQENWVYRADVKADTQARIRLRAVPYNGSNTYSWFRGKEGEITNENNTEQLIEGKAGTQYTIRVIYDFKTDHLICAWVPDGNVIPDTIVVNADLMLLRENHGDAAQLKFSTNGGQLKDITVAYSVINITKEHLSDQKKTPREKEIYWISFPYDVNLSDVFGCGKYGEHFIIQYYDGAARAEKGCWADSPTFWTYIENPTGVVLKKGLGYVLVLDSKKILEDQFQYNNASVNIYFPSSGPIDSIDAKLPTAVEVPAHKCTIERDKRYIYDSNWNIIGVPTWANIDKFYNPMMPEQSGETKVGFYYAHNASNNEWSVCNAQNINFQSMYSYLVQWAGTINWQEKSATGEHHPSSLAPRRYAPAEGEGEATAPEQYTLCLTLNRGGQQLDHTYVRLQEGNVTTDFDLNYDMTKILNSGANLYSLVGTNLIQCAANVQPLQEEARTISIPLGVVADQDGLYTFSLPEGTEGMNVSIADYESGTVHNLALGDYQTALTKGTYEGRFALEIRPRQEVTTGCEQTDAAGKHLRKVLIDGNLYILRDGKAYTAAGQEL